MNSEKKGGFAAVQEKVKKVISAFNRWLSKGFDRIVYSKRASMIVSLLAAVVICIGVNYEDLSYTFFNADATTYNATGIPVEVQADTDTYEITGLPATVDLTVTGDPADIQVFRNNISSVSVLANLRDFGEGENTVTFTVNNVSNSLSVTINPSTATVDLDKKLTRNFAVTPELLLGSGQKAGDFETPVLSVSSVTVKATQSQLDAIRSVKALVDVSGETGDFQTTAAVVAYDGSGNKLNVQITPDTVTATVKIRQANRAEDDSSASNADTNTEEDVSTNG